VSIRLHNSKSYEQILATLCSQLEPKKEEPTQVDLLYRVTSAIMFYRGKAATIRQSRYNLLQHYEDIYCDVGITRSTHCLHHHCPIDSHCNRRGFKYFSGRLSMIAVARACIFVGGAALIKLPNEAMQNTVDHGRIARATRLSTRRPVDAVSHGEKCR